MTHSMRCAFHIPGLKSECCLDLCLQFDTMESPECPNDSILDLVIFDLLLSDSWETLFVAPNRSRILTTV